MATSEQRRDYNHRYYTKRYARDKEYYLAKNRKRQKELKAWFVALRESFGGCLYCPENDVECMDFHHPIGNKDNMISSMIRLGCAREKILEEISKCVMVCANCHRKIRAGREVHERRERSKYEC